MSKLKNRIKKELNEVTSDDFAKTITTMKDTVQGALPTAEPEEIDDIITSTLTVNEVVDGSAVVQFDSERSGEEPFHMNGIKWQYVNGIYPNGKRDIAVYRFDHDLTYDYEWFRKTFIDRDYESHVDEEMGRPRLQQKSNPEFEPTNRPRLQQKSNQPLDEFDDDAVGRGIGAGMNPESRIDYAELDKLINQLNSEDGEEQGGLNLTKTNDTTDELPFESVRPRMTKDELMESIFRKTKKSKVIKTIKVKDIKNGK